MTQPTATAFLALWNSVSSARLQPEYEVWHTFEHVPERVGLPGFVEARRYRAHADHPGEAPRYYTCYWLASLAALETPQYRDVFTHPTPWSTRMRGELRDFLRLPCTLQGTRGPSCAAQLATLQLRSQAPDFPAAVAGWLREQVQEARLVRASWGSVGASAEFPLANQVGVAAAAGHDHVVMLEGLDLTSLQQAAAAMARTASPDWQLASPPAFFELLSLVRQDELDPPAGPRPAARMDLYKAYPTGDNA
ncbi:MAG: hypothetical protein HYX45_03615 [Burkholderiales bacterium]|nr:hypothetical protein [Burkholderiales bacterium]MCZ8294080.1 hypothetical protein [Hylemonella sp.]